jgi:hypothetical protein
MLRPKYGRKAAMDLGDEGESSKISVLGNAEGRPKREPEGKRLARRNVLTALGAGAGAAVVLALRGTAPDPAEAATGGNFILGQVNDADQTTKLKQTAPGGAPNPVFEVEAADAMAIYAHANGIGISGIGSIGVNGASGNPVLPGVLGMNNGGGPGVRGAVGSASGGVEGHNAGSGPGVSGDSVGGPGVKGASTQAAGVFGASSGAGPGVSGDSAGGPGVKGTSTQAAGVFGESSGAGPGILGNSTGSGVGVKASHSGAGVALEVDGPARFVGAVGAGTVAAKADSAFVSNALVTGSSHVSVSLTADPGSSASIQWIERSPGSGFTVHLSGKVNNSTGFSYLIVEP